MSQSTSSPNLLEQKIWQEEKRFLMRVYAMRLVQKLEGGEETNAQSIRSLQIARTYAGRKLVARIDALLSAVGADVEIPADEEDSLASIGRTVTDDGFASKEDGGTNDSDDMDLFDDEDEENFSLDEDEDGKSGDLFDRDIEDEEDEEVDGLFEDDEEESESLFEQELDDGDSLFGKDTENEEEGEEEESLFEKDVDDDDSLFEKDTDDGDSLFEKDTDDDDSLFEKDTEDEEGTELLAGNKMDAADRDGESGATNRTEAVDAAAAKATRRKKRTSKDAPPLGDDGQDGKSQRSSSDEEEDEDAGVLFEQDIYSGNSGARRPNTKGEDTAEFEPTQGHEQQDTPGFEPTQGHEQQDTPGFTPTQGHEQQDTPGFTPTQGHEQQDTPGFTPTKGEKGPQDTPEFEPIQGHEQQDTPGFEAQTVEKKESVIGKKRPVVDAPAPESKIGRRQEVSEEESGEGDKPSRLSARERMAKAKEELERRKKTREAQLKAREEEADSGEEEGANPEELLANLAHHIELVDLEQKLGIQIIPEDRLRLDRQLAKKMREPCIQSLLTTAKDEGLSLVMLPRLFRFIREGQLFKVTGANLLRSYPQLFENIQQVALKLRTEPFFVQESPELDWIFTTTEILPDSRDKTYMQQKQALKQHAHNQQANERRVRRRNLVDALYDLIAVNAVADINMLSATVDLTESRIGRQNLAFINFGENGIRISDIGRQQTHPQLGVCPNW